MSPLTKPALMTAFVLVLVACTSHGEPHVSQARSDRRTGDIHGTAVIEAQCPSGGCAYPSIVLARAEVVALDATGRAVARTRTDSEGAFRIRLAAGRYTVFVAKWQRRQCALREVRVVGGRTVPVNPCSWPSR